MERDDEDEPQPYRLPSDSERIWLHPSELGALLPAEDLPPRRKARGFTPPAWRGMAVPVVSGMVGAALSLGILAAAGGLDRGSDPVVERVVDTAAYDLGQSDSVSRLVDAVAPTLVTVRSETPTGVRYGSGVIFRSDGHVLTSHHLVDGAGRIELISADGQSWLAHTTGVDPETGLAVVAMPASKVQSAILGSARRLRVGQLAVVVGAPGTPQGTPSATAGVIAGLGEVVHVRGRPVYDLIATDAAIGVRAAGGPLLDGSGAVVGIATRMVGANGDDHMGLAIPIDIARRVADDLILHGRTTYAWCGVTASDLDPGSAGEYGVTKGTLVQDVAKGSPADRAGISAGDVVTAVGHSPVSSMNELMMLVRRHEPGEEVAFTVVRGGVTRKIHVSLAEAPPAP
jgi:S1-C subfamily serine protease